MAFLIFLLLAWLGGSEGLDPCTHHTAINNTHRRVDYEMHHSEHGLCDIGLMPNWYRFIQGKMPESCVQKYHCGTIVPVWMNGKHPTQVNTTAKRPLCANFGQTGDCCDSTLMIDVRNCGTFYVYYLQPTPTCSVAYCAGGDPSNTPCAAGMWSSDGYPPCKEAYPILTTNPEISNPKIVTYRKFTFTCSIDYPKNDADQVFEVMWTSDGHDIGSGSHDFFRDPQRSVELDGIRLQNHLGKTLGCKIRMFYCQNPDPKTCEVQQNAASEWRASRNTYWAGIMVNPAQLEISEDGIERNITVTSTVPIICTNPRECCLTLSLDTNGPRNNVAMPHTCHYKICTEHWNDQSNTASINVPLVATKDKTDGTQTSMINFRQITQTTGGAYLDVFAGYQFLSAKVVVTDIPQKMCSWVTDPHLTTFANKRFDLWRVGDFTMFENKDDNFEVQVRTYWCNTERHIACNCGVAIKDQNTLVRISNCGDRTATPIVDVVRGHLECDGTTVDFKDGGNKILISFTSGRQITVETNGYYMDVHLTVRGSDKNHGQGICGTLDDDDYNEFMHRGGRVDCASCNTQQIYAFIESWKNVGMDSLFIDVPGAVQESRNNRFCQCDAGVTGSPRINCVAGGDVTDNPQDCAGCTRVQNTGGTTWKTPTAGITPVCTNILGRRSADNSYQDFDEPEPPFEFGHNKAIRSDSVITWPTTNGTTEVMARQLCEGALRTSPLWPHCQNMTDTISIIISNCLSDILYMDSFEAVPMAETALSTVCHADVVSNPANFQTSADGQSDELKQEISSLLCSVVCLEHGRCEQGQCVCEPGYIGGECQMEDKPPRLLRVRGSAYCDIIERPCRKIYFDANNFLLSNDFTCKVIEILPNGTLARTVAIEHAEFINSMRLACPLPDANVKTDRSIKTYTVSVSSDGTRFSNALNITVFDSTCHECNNITGCSTTLKPNTCHIDDLCYVDGQVNTVDASQVCDATNTTHWSINYPPCGERTGTEWTVFQRRHNGSVNFERNWQSYRQGFGNVRGEFWMGLEQLSSMTARKNYELRVDMEDWEGNSAYALYANFSITNEADKFRILFDSFAGGTAGDSLSSLNSSQFSTSDMDNDHYSGSCASVYHGAWWFDACSDSFLNGVYSDHGHAYGQGLIWQSFKGYSYSLKCSEMKVKPIN